MLGLCCCESFSLVVGATLVAVCGLSHCSGFSCYGARALGHEASVVAAPQLWSTDSVAVAHGLSCSGPMHWQVDSLPLSHQGSPGR